MAAQDSAGGGAEAEGTTYPYARLFERLPFIFGGLGGVAALSVIQLSTLSTFDLPTQVALVSLAVSIPCSVMVLFLALEGTYPRSRHFEPGDRIFFAFRFALFAGSLLTSFIGLAAVFWHFAWWIAVVFIVASAGAFYLTFELDSRAQRHAQRGNSP